MKAAKAWAAAAILLPMIGPIRGAVAATPASADPDAAIFVANNVNVTAYPVGTDGDVAPIALTTGMANPSSIAEDASGRIYVANNGTNTVTVYAAGANGNVPPLAVIGGSNTGLNLPVGIALDASGKIYVLNGATNLPGVNVYPPLGSSTGILNQAPIASIAGSQTLLDYPDSIALDSQGNIYVANEGPIVSRKLYDYGRITIYPAGSNGNIAPTATISGVKTGLAYPTGIAVDSGGNIYVGNFYTANTKGEIFSSVTVYSAGSKGNARPIAVISGDNTSFYYPQGMALDSSGNLYVSANLGGISAIEIFPAGSNGNVSPAVTITGADTGLSFPHAIALDAGGSIYVLNDNDPNGIPSVTAYPAGSSGNAAPIATITSAFTGINAASSVAVDSIGNIYVANENGSEESGSIGSIAVYSAGSYVAGPPISTIAGGNTGLELPYGIALDSTDNIYVLNLDNTITVYPAGSTGNVTPAATIYVDSSGESTATGIAVGSGGDLYITNVPGNLKCHKGSCHYTGVTSVAVYPAGSNGYATPTAVIKGSHTGLFSPEAVAVDQSGDIYVVNGGRKKCTRNSCGPTRPGSVSVYAPGSNGDVKPVARISGADTRLEFPSGIALDSNGNIYVLNLDEPFAGIEHSILIFAAGSRGNTAPMDAISGPSAGLNGGFGIAVGPGGP